MIIDNVPEFSKWLMNLLPSFCAADPDTLSDYIIALINKAKSENNFIAICNEALVAFLGEKTEVFVEGLYDSVKNKKYIVSSPNKIKENEIVLSSVELENSKGNIIKVESSTHIKTKSSNDVSSDDEHWHNKSPNPHLRQHRSGDNSRHRFETRKRKRSDFSQEHNSRHRPDSRNRSNKIRHSYERSNHGRKDDNKYKKQNNGRPYGDVKVSCVDFVEKGVCLKGDSCEYDHGNQIVISDIKCIYSGVNMIQNTIASAWPTNNTAPNWIDNFNADKPYAPLKPFEVDTDYRKRRKKTDVYDPSHPEINAITAMTSQNMEVSAPVYVPSEVENSGNKESAWWKEVDANSTETGDLGDSVSHITNSRLMDKNDIPQPNRKKFHNHNENRNNNNSNNNRRPNNGKCLLLTHIPTECNNEIQLRQHFLKFGNVTDVVVGFQDEPHNSLVEFATTEQAKSAFRSPAPILDNRFIRTSLYNRPASDGDRRREPKNFSQQPQQQTQNRPRPVLMDTDSSNMEPKRPDTFSRKRLLSACSNNSIDHQPQHYQQHKRWPNPNELKLDRRNKTEITALGNPSTIAVVIKPTITKSVVSAPEPTPVEKEVTGAELAQRLVASIESSKKRLHFLLDQQKQPECDMDLIKRQLVESYNYYKELKDTLENVRKKQSAKPQLSELDKIKLKIQEAQSKLPTMDREDDSYRQQLKCIIELKRKQLSLQSAPQKFGKPAQTRIPTQMEMRLDNRPKILYLSGFPDNVSLQVQKQIKEYEVESLTSSDNGIKCLEVEFKTRKEADRATKELSKFFELKKVVASFTKPRITRDPLDFDNNVVSLTPSYSPDTNMVETNAGETTGDQRGTPSGRDEEASSDEDAKK